MAFDYWWWESRVVDRQISLTAAPFGYGPRVACERLVSGLTLEQTPWEKTVIPYDTDILINFGVVDPKCVYRQARYRIWIDCLAWLRTQLPAVVEDHNMALAEAFFPTRKALLQQADLVDVQPLIGRPIATPSDSRDMAALVSLGGVEMLHGSDIHHIDWPVQLLRALNAEKHENMEYRVHGPRELIDRWSKGSKALFEFAAPTRSEHEVRASAASLLIIQPGLYGAFEAFASGCQVAFTPSFSYTQVGQALALSKYGVLEMDPWTHNLIDSFGQDLEYSFGEEQARFYAHMEQHFRKQKSSEKLFVQLREWAHSVVGQPATTRKRAEEKLIDSMMDHPSASELIEPVLAGTP